MSTSTRRCPSTPHLPERRPSGKRCESSGRYKFDGGMADVSWKFELTLPRRLLSVQFDDRTAFRCSKAFRSSTFCVVCLIYFPDFAVARIWIPVSSNVLSRGFQSYANEPGTAEHIVRTSSIALFSPCLSLLSLFLSTRFQVLSSQNFKIKSSSSISPSRIHLSPTAVPCVVSLAF